MNAFVLSGGGNLGSVQAGMLEALLDTDVRPDILVGTSIGAANAAFIAADPSLDDFKGARWTRVGHARVKNDGKRRQPRLT